MDQSLNNVTQPWYRIHSTLIDNDCESEHIGKIPFLLYTRASHFILIIAEKWNFMQACSYMLFVLVCKNWRFHDAMTAKLWSFFLMLIALSILPRFLCGKFLLKNRFCKWVWHFTLIKKHPYDYMFKGLSLGYDSCNYQLVETEVQGFG